MAWYPGKNIVRAAQGEKVFPGLRRPFDRQRELKDRGMNAEKPAYDAGALGQFGGAATSGAQALAGARGAQAGALGMYTDMAQGNGPSLAQAQLAQSGAQTVADQQAMAAQARGGNLAAQARQAQGAGAAAQMGNAQQMAALQAQEQQAALAGQAGMANTMAGQGLQQQGMGLGLMGQAHGQQLGADTQWGLGQRELDLQQLEGNRGVFKGIVGAAAGLGGAAIMSDERLKTGVAPGGASEALAALGGGATFDYVPGAGPEGRRIGVMAQDMERTPAGASAVVESPVGKGIDVGQGLGLALAGASEHEHRLRRIEDALGATSSPPVINTREGPRPALAGSSFKPQTMGSALGRMA